MNVVLLHDRYTPIGSFIEILGDNIKGNKLTHTINVVDKRKVYVDMFDQDVDNGRFDAFYDFVQGGINDMHDQNIARLPRLCDTVINVLIYDATARFPTELEGCKVFITVPNSEKISEFVKSFNPSETAEAQSTIVKNQVGVLNALKDNNVGTVMVKVGHENINSVRLSVNLIISDLLLKAATGNI